jgi:hypothetical protein
MRNNIHIHIHIHIFKNSKRKGHMKNKLFTILATALLLVGLAGLASAASITFDFTSLTTTFFPTGLTFGSGLTVEATGDAYQGPPDNTLIARGIHQDDNGIGVWSTSGDNDVDTDNGGRVDRMYLDFSSDVLLTQAAFTSYGTGDVFCLAIPLCLPQAMEFLGTQLLKIFLNYQALQ